MRRHDRRRALRRRGNPREGQQLAAPHAQIRDTSATASKSEFDRYIEGALWRGLDKLSLDAAFQGQQLSEKLHRLRPNGAARRPRAAALLRVGDGKRRAARPLPRGRRARRKPSRCGTSAPAHGRLYKPDYRSLDDENADVALIYSGRRTRGATRAYSAAQSSPYRRRTKGGS